MARKQAAAQSPLPDEQRPEFLALLAELPAASEVAALERIADDSLALFNDAVRGHAPEQAALARRRWEAVVYRQHGDSFFGCSADDGAKTRLLARQAAQPGAVPGWGQDGQWFAEVNGMRLWIKARHWSSHASLEFHAIDADQPFISETGYRAHYLDYQQWLGHEFGAAVRLELERGLQGKGMGPRSIKAEYRERLDVPAWLAPALEGVMGNGQQALPLSGRAPLEVPAALPVVPDEPKAPMSNADRQRAFRQRQKEQRAQAKAEGRRTFELSDVDLSHLWIALNTHIAFDEPLDWQLQGFRELAGRLFAHQHSFFLERLGLDADGVHNRQKQLDKDAKRGWDAYKEERKRAGRLVAKINDLQQENAELKAGLQEIAAELGGAPVVPAKPMADVAALQAEVARLHAQVERQHTDNLNTVADLGRALQVTQAMQDRLKAANLPHDYRQYLS